MTVLRISKLGDECIVTSLKIGEHVIGRGQLLKCDDKRVSRRHAVIIVSEGSAAIKSVHVNPCFLMSSNSKTVTILPKESSVPLLDNDKFALLPDMFWFKVEIVNDNNDISLKGANVDVSDNKTVPSQCDIEPTTSKRTINEEEVDHTSKRIKLENDNQSDESKCRNRKEVLSDSDDENLQSVKQDDIKQINPPKQETGEQQHENNDTKEIAESVEEKLEPTSQVNATVNETQDTTKTVSNGDGCAQSSSGTSSQRRERCWYGPSCYRKNPRHRRDFSHTDDPDYDSDPNDNHPTCSFGGTCYRKMISV